MVHRTSRPRADRPHPLLRDPAVDADAEAFIHGATAPDLPSPGPEPACDPQPSDGISDARTRLYTAREAAHVFRRTTRTLRTWVKRGILRPTIVNRSVYFTEAEVNRVITDGQATADRPNPEPSEPSIKSVPCDQSGKPVPE